eukprot:7864774-Pyramimonas_sp.AAC.1
MGRHCVARPTNMPRYRTAEEARPGGDGAANDARRRAQIAALPWGRAKETEEKHPMFPVPPQTGPRGAEMSNVDQIHE